MDIFTIKWKILGLWLDYCISNDNWDISFDQYYENIMHEAAHKAKQKQILSIIHKYMSVEGWKEAFITDLNNAGFRITYDPNSPHMVIRKINNKQKWTD